MATVTSPKMSTMSSPNFTRNDTVWLSWLWFRSCSSRVLWWRMRPGNSNPAVTPLYSGVGPAPPSVMFSCIVHGVA